MPLARAELAIAEDAFQDLLRVERGPRSVRNGRFEQRASAPLARSSGRPIVRNESEPVHTSLMPRAGPPRAPNGIGTRYALASTMTRGITLCFAPRSAKLWLGFAASTRV